MTRFFVYICTLEVKMESNWFVDEFSERIWEQKYKGDTNSIEEFFERLAKLVARGDEALAKKFYKLMYEKKFIPGGRILTYGGRPEAHVSLMNCTTHQIEKDSLESISETAYVLMRASSRGQGIGVDISKLRPKEAPVNNAAKTSTGSISFMEMLNSIGSTIGQEGRRAAILFSLDITHPDIFRNGSKDQPCPRCEQAGCDYCNNTGYLPYDFLHVKKISGKVENANISIKLSDEFLNAVVADKPWLMEFTGNSSRGIIKETREVMARDLFMTLAKSAHESAEPGILYWDTAKRMSNSDVHGYPIVGVNACSEENLDQDGVCDLGSINFVAYVRNPFSAHAYFDMESFVEDIKTAVTFLDNVIDIELERGYYISEKQKQSLEQIRRIGLGVMGTADMLAMLGYIYGSEESIEYLRKIAKAFRDASYKASNDLAIEKGPAPIWLIRKEEREQLVRKAFYATLDQEMKSKIVEHGLRNVTIMSIAPTGTISNLIGVSSGIEPIFAHSYTRMTRIHGYDEYINYVHPGVQMSRVAGLPDEIYPTAYEVTPTQHLEVHGVFQRYVDASISKTLNFPKTSSIQDVYDAYLMAWNLGIKGLSVYVDGSRDLQVLFQEDDDEDEEEGGETCPECGSHNPLMHKEGCIECAVCGWSLCTL